MPSPAQLEKVDRPESDYLFSKRQSPASAGDGLHLWIELLGL